MFKYKQLIIGFILGALVFSVVPVGAAIEEFICYKADYKVVIKGVEYNDSDLPILNYKGNTYAPFRSMLKKAGLNVTWNAELGQAEVTSNPTNEQNTISKGDSNSMSTATKINRFQLPEGAEYFTITKDDVEYKAFKYNGETYVPSTYLGKVYDIKISDYNISTGERTFKTSSKSIKVNTDNPGIIFSIDGVHYYKLSALKELTGE